MASKSKKRRRVLGASCILAALIIAGSSFAWFTSSDEVTNRLSASADYGVRIVESFAPPAEWVPGQTVNKDVYATNTGSIAAYVREDVSGVLTLTKEEPFAVNEWETGDSAGKVKTLSATDTSVKITDFVELTKENAYLSIEAGSYLAYKPAKSTAELGRQVVAFNPDGTGVVNYVFNDGSTLYTMTEAGFVAAYGPTGPDDRAPSDSTKLPTGVADTTKANAWTKVEAKTDFTPDAEGLYVFRRIINVDKYGMEEFDYDGYYFKDGKYYKVTNIKPVQDDSVATGTDVSYLDRAGDGKENDGQLSSATADFLLEKTTVYNQPTSFTYDAANNRLVATYFSKTSPFDWSSTDTNLDKAEHNLAMQRAALDRAIRDHAELNSTAQSYLNQAAQLTNELNDVNSRLNEIGTDSTDPSILYTLNGKKTGYDETTNGSIDKAYTAISTAWNALYGAAYPNGVITGVDNTQTGAARLAAVNADDYGKYTAPVTPAGGTADALNDAIDDIKTARTNHESKFEDYVAELQKLYNKTTGSTPTKVLEDNDDYDAVIRKLTVTQLREANFSQNPELHNINELTVAYLVAKAAYDEDVTDLANAIKQYRTAVVGYGDKGTTTTSPTQITETIGGVEVKYDDYVVSGESGVLGEIARTEAEKSELEAKKAALEAKINTAMTNAANTIGTVGNTIDDTLAAAVTAYKGAAEAYDTALAAYNAKKKEFDNNQELKIYINLSDDVGTEGGIANRWQLLNSNPLDDFWSTTPDGVEAYTADGNADTAVFYYTSILEGGESSTKLIDSVTLDSGVTQDMYKYFDYDLNVALKSAQINYADDNETIKADTTPTELDATATLSNNKDINTAITWSANPTTAAAATGKNVSGVPVTVSSFDPTGITALTGYNYKVELDAATAGALGKTVGTYVGDNDTGTFKLLNATGNDFATSGETINVVADT